MSQMNNKDIEKLLDKAGPRLKPDEAIRDEIYKEVHDHWLKTHRVKFYQSTTMKIAASFLVLVLLFAFTQFNLGSTPDYNIASSIQIQGQIQVSQDNINWVNLHKDKKIHPGDYIKTQKNNRLLVNLYNGNQFRINESSVLRVDGNDHLTLLKGMIYVDSDHSSSHHKLTIETALGSVDHIGTQYMVGYQNNELNVGVRNGRVLIADNLNKATEVIKGQALLLNHQGHITQSVLKPSAEIWQWTQKIASHFPIQNKSLVDYLQWVSSETGLAVSWQKSQDKNSALNVKLSGSIQGIDPIESLNVIMPTTRFTHEIKNNQIYISVNSG